MGKNIVIFSDGTGQEGGVLNNTNVYDLFNMIEDRTERQVSFYDRGLGTTGWQKFTGLIGGGGISKNIQECYEFISNCYNAGDQIYLFGFSRGATTVRTLSAFIDLFGILPKSRPELIKRAYKIYQITKKEKREERRKKFLRLNKTMYTRVKFLGVWDTVAALGFPIKSLSVLIDQIPYFHHSFHDLRLSKSVDFARHALAIDDERLTFHPALWDETEERDEERRRKTQSSSCSADDVADIYLVATKLKAAADPVSKRLFEMGLTFSPANSRSIKPFVAWLKRCQLEQDKESPAGKKGNLAKLLIGRFSAEVQEVLEDDETSPTQRKTVCEGLNQIIRGSSIYNEEAFEGIPLRDETQALLALSKDEGLRAHQLARLNRLLLEDAFDQIPKVREEDRLAPRTEKLLNEFDSDGRRRESPERIQELKTALARVFNQAIRGVSLYDPVDADLFTVMEFSAETNDLINLNRQDKPSVRMLNRSILEDAFSLKPANPPRLKQVWFAGMHTDVGGGYPENELARVPLMWMVKEAMDVGLLIYANHKVDLTPDATGIMHNSRERLARIYRKRSRFWDANKNQGKLPLVHESVEIRKQSEECGYEPWILKMKHETEPWPKRLRSSVQFNAYYVWREAMWGFGGAFAVPWSAVKRVSYDELRRTIRLETEIESRKDTIVINGSLSKGIRDQLSSAFDRQKLKEREEKENRRENARQDKEDERQRAEDKRLARLTAELSKKVEKHSSELKQKDATIEEQIRRLEAQEQRLRDQDATFKKEIATIRAQIAPLSEQAELKEEAPAAESTKRQKPAAK